MDMGRSLNPLGRAKTITTIIPVVVLGTLFTFISLESASTLITSVSLETITAVTSGGCPGSFTGGAF